ncbi:unnamed protein product [Pieris macdunnoughi]|uniref:Uncharacterized protein n=1 Tax=Pieris macdunnoughi TaxID=345717 RepID=A0A821VMP7_9NEOP|nr:unnamed protein product [Pieris macdunnoughi]
MPWRRRWLRIQTVCIGEGSRKENNKKRFLRLWSWLCFQIGDVVSHYISIEIVWTRSHRRRHGIPCARSVSAVPPVKVPVRASVTPHKRRYTYYNRMFKPIAYHLPKPLTISLV